MKLVSYTCPNCGHQAQYMKTKQSFKRECACGAYVRSFKITYNYHYQPQYETCHVNELMRDNERWSWAMGVNPKDIPAAMKQFPGSVYNSEGQLLIRNRNHKLKEMKRRGYVECDGYRNRNGIRTKGKR